METSQALGLEQAIVEFCRFARTNGIAAGVKESLEAVRATNAVGIADRQNLKFALRAVLCSTKADWDIFDEIFDAFWSESARPANYRVASAVRMCANRSRNRRARN